MSDYAIGIFWSDEDDEYVAVVPELGGCSASGAMHQEALDEVLTAKDLWLEVARERGYPIPQPGTHPGAPPERATG